MNSSRINILVNNNVYGPFRMSKYIPPLQIPITKMSSNNKIRTLILNNFHNLIFLVQIYFIISYFQKRM